MCNCWTLTADFVLQGICAWLGIVCNVWQPVIGECTVYALTLSLSIYICVCVWKQRILRSIRPELVRKKL